MYRVMWVRAMDDTISRLVDHSVGGLTFVGSLQQNDVFMPHLEHLTCFLPGNIALGVAFGAVTGPKADLYMELAQNVTYTCWQMYDRMPSGETGLANSCAFKWGSAAASWLPAGVGSQALSASAKLPAVLSLQCTSSHSSKTGTLCTLQAWRPRVSGSTQRPTCR